MVRGEILKCFNCDNEATDRLFCSDKCRNEHFRERDERRRKSFWNNHREDVTWHADLICKSLKGCWIEVKYSPEMGKGMEYFFKMEGHNKISKSLYEDVVRKLDRIFWLYFVKWEWTSPFFIQVNDEGKFILAMCKDKHGNMQTYNKVMREGKSSIVKISNG